VIRSAVRGLTNNSYKQRKNSFFSFMPPQKRWASFSKNHRAKIKAEGSNSFPKAALDLNNRFFISQGRRTNHSKKGLASSSVSVSS
jgi:hypothetical protein